MENNIINEMGFDMKDNPNNHNNSKVEIKEDNNSAEETLIVIAIITLVLGFIASVILFFTICFVDNPNSYGYGSSSPKTFSASGFGTTIGVFLSSLITWALLKVFANISLTLKDIKRKMQK